MTTGVINKTIGHFKTKCFPDLFCSARHRHVASATSKRLQPLETRYFTISISLPVNAEGVGKCQRPGPKFTLFKALDMTSIFPFFIFHFSLK